MKNKIYKIFEEGFQQGQYIRLGENPLLKLYIGKSSTGNYSFEYRGKYTPNRLSSSDVIEVQQAKTEDGIYLVRFSLTNSELLEYFCTFCEDLFQSSQEIVNDAVAYKTITNRYLSWKKMFRPHAGKMTEPEIIGLIGELLFLDKEMIPLYGVVKSLESWTGPEKTHKDFSIDNRWYEVKTISSGKSSVTIYSLEQLDSEIDGNLIVYELERMSPSFNGLKLNDIVQKIISEIGPVNRDIFISKLELYNYDFSPSYDNYVYAEAGFASYLINDNFPRLRRNELPIEITRVQYEISLSDIAPYKI